MTSGSHWVVWRERRNGKEIYKKTEMIEGLDYNTQRERLRMPEYGRSISQMVEHCIGIENRQERQACAENIIKIMEKMHPVVRQQADYMSKLWNHLAIISKFKLDIDYPCEVTTEEQYMEKPSPLEYPKGRIPVRHYGDLVFKTLDHLKTMPEGPERDELTRLVANKMKSNLAKYGTSAPENERVISDIAQFSDGVIQIDPENFVFDNVARDKKTEDKSKKKKKK